MKKVLLLILVSILFSCQSKQEKIQNELMDNINKAYSMLDYAMLQPETDLTIPLGFELNCTEKEYKTQCDYLIQKNGGRYNGTLTYIMTQEVGNVEREVRTSMFNYFSDPNTMTDTVASISFIFDEFRNNANSNGGWKKLLDDVSKKFDDSWETVEYNLDESDGEKSTYDFSVDFYKYWVKGNMAVEFTHNGFHSFSTLEFFNVPKYGTKFFKDNVNRTLKIKADVQKQMQEKKATLKIENSVWDGSVRQVKKYLKKNLKDPESYESIEWGKVIYEGDVYKVRHKYRAKNSFGGYVIEEFVFILNEKGEVIETLKL